MSVRASSDKHVAQKKLIYFLTANFPSLISVSAQDGSVVLGKARTRSVPSLSSLPKVSLETVPIFVWLNTDLGKTLTGIDLDALSMDETCQIFKESLIETPSKGCGVKKAGKGPVKKTPWWNDNVKEAMKDNKKLYKA